MTDFNRHTDTTGPSGPRASSARQAPRAPIPGRRGQRRRWLFRAWIALTAAVAAFVAVADPFALTGLLPSSLVAYSVPPLMILLLGLSLAWLVAVTARGRRAPGRAARVLDR